MADLLRPRNRARESSPLKRLLAQASRQEAWTAQLRVLLSPDLREIVSVVNVRDHVLTVHTSGAAWATRIRFLINALLPKLNRLEDFAEVTRVEVRVASSAAPDEPRSEQSRRTVAGVPHAESLKQLASDSDYAGLKEALLRLASHGEARHSAHNEDRVRSEPESAAPKDADPGPDPCSAPQKEG